MSELNKEIQAIIDRIYEFDKQEPIDGELLNYLINALSCLKSS